MWNKWQIMQLVLFSQWSQQGSSVQDVLTFFTACFQKTDFVFVPSLTLVIQGLFQLCLQCIFGKCWTHW